MAARDEHWSDEKTILFAAGKETRGKSNGFVEQNSLLQSEPPSALLLSTAFHRLFIHITFLYCLFGILDE